MDRYDVVTGAAAEDVVPQGSYEKPDAVTLSEELEARYKSAAQEWRTQVETDRDYFRTIQTTSTRRTEAKKVQQKQIVVDCISPAVEQAIALLTSNKPRFMGTPREDSDVRIARLISDYFAYLWDVNRGNQNLKLLIRDYYVSSMGWWIVTYDPYADAGRGSIRLQPVDALNVYVDPNAKDFFFDDAAHIIISTTLSAEQIQMMIPDAGEQIFPFANGDSSDDRPSTSYEGLNSEHINKHARDLYSQLYRCIDRYSRIKVKKLVIEDPVTAYRRIVDPQEKDNEYAQRCFRQIDQSGPKYFVDPASVSDAAKLFEAFGEVFHGVQTQDGQTTFMPGDEREHEDPNSQAIPGSTIRLTPITVREAIADGAVTAQEAWVDRIQRTYSIGGVLVSQEELQCTVYPVIPLVNNFDRTPYAFSDIRRVRPIQDIINQGAEAMITHAENTANLKVSYPKAGFNEAELRKKWNQRGVTFLPTDPELGELKVLSPTALPAEFYQLIERSKADIERILGIYAMMQGSSADAPATYSATMALEDFGQRRIRSKRDDVEEFLNRTATVIVEYLNAYERGYKVVRLVRPNGKSYTLEVNAMASKRPADDLSDSVERIADLTSLQMDVQIVSGSMLPTNRWAQFEYYMKMYESGIIDQQEVLKKTDVVDVEGVMDRFNQIKMLQQQLAGATEEIKRLEGDMQTKDRELGHALKKMEVMQFEKELSKQKSRAQAAVELFTARLGDEVKMSRQKKEKK